MLTAIFLSSLSAASAGKPSVPLPSQVREAVFLADGMKIAVGEFVNKTNRLPVSNEEAGLPAPTLIRGRYVTSGAIDGSRIRFEFGPGADRSLVSRHLFFEAKLDMVDGRFTSLMWICKSDDIAPDACPKSCACTGGNAQDEPPQP